jgi:transcriptional regulator with XRE-family HTH domain
VATDKNDPKVIFGERVRSFRAKRSLSQEQLADLAELDRTYISGIERGIRNVSLLNIVKIADALDINPSELLKGI